MTNTCHFAISSSMVITADILLAERCLNTCATVLRHDGKSFDAARIGRAPFILLGHPRDHARPARRDGWGWRSPAALQQGG